MVNSLKTARHRGLRYGLFNCTHLIGGGGTCADSGQITPHQKENARARRVSVHLQCLLGVGAWRMRMCSGGGLAIDRSRGGSLSYQHNTRRVCRWVRSPEASRWVFSSFAKPKQSILSSSDGRRRRTHRECELVPPLPRRRERVVVLQQQRRLAWR